MSKMLSPFLVAILLAANLVDARAADPSLPQRAMPDMQGQCSNFGWNMAEEFKLWDGAPSAAIAKPSSDDLPALTLGARYNVALKPHVEVSFAAKPEQDRGAPTVFSGLVAFVVPRTGIYRVSASNGLWIDVVRNGTVIPSSAFEMQTKCATIFKSVAYRFDASDRMILQLSGSRTDQVGLLISLWTD